MPDQFLYTQQFCISDQLMPARLRDPIDRYPERPLILSRISGISRGMP